MDKQVRRHIMKRGVRLAQPERRITATEAVLGDGSAKAVFAWFLYVFHGLGIHRRPGASALGAAVVIAMATIIPNAALWLALKAIDARLRRMRRPTYYERERERRRALAAERRRIRRRRTLSPCPTPQALADAFRRAKRSPADMIRFGSLLEDLECYVDNSIIWDRKSMRIKGRRSGIRGFLSDNVPELALRYKTVMRYKALSKRFRQAVGAADPVPASALLPAIEDGPETDARGEAATVAAPEKGRERDAERIWAPAAMREKAVGILKECGGTMIGLSARIALLISEDFIPDENTARNESLTA